MGTGRLEAFSDGVIAIIITIMVLEMKVPHGADIQLLKPVLPVFLSYILSFIYIGIYWNNHHHLLHAAKEVSGSVLWANLHLLFWLSLTPFVSGWMGENHFAKWPVVIYGFILLMSGIAYYILSQKLASVHDANTTLAGAIGTDKKGKLSIILYILGIVLTFIHPWIGFFTYVVVACIWFMPDKRIEKKIEETEEKENTKEKNNKQ